MGFAFSKLLKDQQHVTRVPSDLSLLMIHAAWAPCNSDNCELHRVGNLGLSLSLFPKTFARTCRPVFEEAFNERKRKSGGDSNGVSCWSDNLAEFQVLLQFCPCERVDECYSPGHLSSRLSRLFALSWLT